MDTANKARRDFEQKNIDVELLTTLYSQYNRVPNVESFIQKALDIFPKLSCGVATVYLRYAIGEGEIISGKYKTSGHTFLLINDRLLDITADQYDGPKIYVGKPGIPWAIK